MILIFKNFYYLQIDSGTSLVVQRLRLCAVDWHPTRMAQPTAAKKFTFPLWIISPDPVFRIFVILGKEGLAKYMFL